jgi:type II secretory pathway component GspD/PulD (secretin)
MSQDIGDIINQISGGDEDAEPAVPRSPIDLLDSDSAATKLQLNNDQREKIKSIIGDFRTQTEEIQKSYDDRLKAITSLGEKLRKRAQFNSEIRTKTGELRTKAEASLLELLNEQQQTTLKTMVPDPKPATPASTPSPGTLTVGRTPGNAPPSSPSQAPARRTENTVASFGPIPDATDAGESNNPQATVADATDGAAPAAQAATDSNATLAFNFQEAPWTDVLKLFAKAAGLTLNIRDVPPGSFTYYDREKYTPAQALDIMNRMLMQNSFILVRHDRFLSVFDANKGVPPNLVETVTAEELSDRGETELLRVALPLGERDAAKAAEEVRSLLGPQGKVAPLESANSIVVTDIAANLLRVQKLLQPPPKLGDDKLTFKAFPLTKIDAAEAADIVRSLLGVQTGVTNVSASQQSNNSRSSRSRGGFDPRQFFSRMRSSGGPTPSASNNNAAQAAATPSTSKVAVDYRTNSVLVNATAANMKLVEQMIEAIDVDPNNIDAIANGRSAREPYLEVYEVSTADASEVAKTLNVLHPGTVVNEDGKNKRIHIKANAEQHREISEHIRQLDGGIAGDTFAVLDLKGLSGYDVATTITGLYKNQPTQAPSIQSDPSGRSLIVRGSVSQIQMVQSMIDSLEKQGPYESSGRAVQVVGSGAASTAFMQQTISSLLPQVTFTAAPQTTNNNNQSSSRNSRSNRNSQSSNGDDDRARRMMEFRERFFGGGGFNRGGSSSGSNSRSGSSRSSFGRSSSGRGR